MPGTLYDLGYAKCRDVRDFTELLDGNHIDILIDVRFSPFSSTAVPVIPSTS